MAFEEKDTSASVQVTQAAEVEEIVFRRNREDPTGPPLIIVTKLETTGSEKHRRSYRVPVATVAAAWPGTAKTLRAHLSDAIDNAE